LILLFYICSIALFDSLLAWFEAAKVDPGVAWETAASVTLSGLDLKRL